ncbi:hypothetical protein BGX23_007399 [Mortierella sp. AD031]|nr:hypothetical protein BGX23_007399 [Mortierella sp. AD031]KAG0208954.1 hypothetical protein BGX33_005923 [Mortierella sp. NVP41]
MYRPLNDLRAVYPDAEFLSMDPGLAQVITALFLDSMDPGTVRNYSVSASSFKESFKKWKRNMERSKDRSANMRVQESDGSIKPVSFLDHMQEQEELD